MEVSATLEALQAEVRCPICLDFLTDPVTIPCGHNFCRSCIQQCWKDLPGRFPCPVCRHPQQERHFSPNSQLARMIDLTKLLHSSSQSRQENALCGQHNQVLGLFCEDDLEVVCGLCTSAHQGHLVRPMEEAASYHRQRLRSYREALKRQVADVDKLVATQDRELVELREQVEHRRWKLASEFERLNQFVEHEQEAAMSKLAEEERDIQQKLSENVNTFTEYISTVKGLLREVAERSVMSEVKLLRGVKSLQDRCQSLEPPAVSSFQLRQEGFSLPPLYSERIIQRFREEVTLDPQTAHPSLLVSEDQKSVTFVRKRKKVPRNRQRFVAEPVVLGAQGFRGGRHYWEVQVGDKAEWAVGLCAEALPWKRQGLLPGQDARWALGLRDGAYVAVGPAPVPLALREKPRGIGVYLDYELGQISFYSVHDRSHIHTFRETFSQVLKPYLCVGRDPEPLTVGAGGEHAG
ncbi:PREDICTED: tripartite motif-containing protein 60 [Condylura cristata]|uniref:tripartite motif-containing protein 60 n=1 Tax=Condylura cristata TaxID=143302 RepID=UPI0003344DA5|nr:PREDICTED: tripartite motif-containing protein 60 [Condylura cristata]